MKPPSNDQEKKQYEKYLKYKRFVYSMNDVKIIIKPILTKEKKQPFRYPVKERKTNPLNFKYFSPRRREEWDFPVQPCKPKNSAVNLSEENKLKPQLMPQQVPKAQQKNLPKRLQSVSKNTETNISIFDFNDNRASVDNTRHPAQSTMFTNFRDSAPSQDFRQKYYTQSANLA